MKIQLFGEFFQIQAPCFTWLPKNDKCDKPQINIRPPLLVALALLAPFVAALPMEAHAFLRAAPKEVPLPQDSPAASSQAPRSHHARQAIEEKTLYDPQNPDISRLQKMEEATRDLPYDTVGFPDWMRALREGLITPRSDLSGKGSMEILDMDIIMKNTKEMPYVRFPHRSHTLWLACSNCHPAPFKPIAGSSAIQMADIFRGQYCGMCHDRVAFVTFFSCSRCHSVPQTSSPAK